MSLESTTCCGVDDWHGLQNDPIATLIEIGDDFFEEGDVGKSAFILITDPVKYGRGKKLIKTIEKFKLGSIAKDKARRNPNSHNMLHAWLWGVNRKEFYKWWRKNGGETYYEKNGYSRDNDW